VPDLLDRILGELRQRFDESRAAVAEYGRLEAALRALEAAQPAGSGPAPRGRPPARTGRRAPHGHNRRAVLDAVGARPGATAVELSAASGVSRPTIYAVLKTLTERGEIRKRELPAGQVGYAPSEGSAPDGTA
jgi:DNA-binding transcriptional ArsR family regulator